MICIAATNSKADDFVNIGGTEYDVTATSSESFNSAEAVLEAQPWWGNESLASEFATAVGGSLGTPNMVPTEPQTPTFAYGLDDIFYAAVDNVDFSNGVLTFWDSTSGAIYPTSDFIFATATVANAPENSTMSLLLIALGSLGLVMAVRKRKAQGLIQAA